MVRKFIPGKNAAQRRQNLKKEKAMEAEAMKKRLAQEQRTLELHRRATAEKKVMEERNGKCLCCDLSPDDEQYDKVHNMCRCPDPEECYVCNMMKKAREQRFEKLVAEYMKEHFCF